MAPHVPPAPTRIPRATYRLQLGGDMGFGAAEHLVSYLHELGVSELYASPFWQARDGSDHGYDVTDPRRLDPAIGTRGQLTGLAARLREHGMGLVADVVPNHMAASPENPWWRSVLEYGRASPYATFFDIDWNGNGNGNGRAGAGVRIVMPVLDAPYERLVAGGRIGLATAGGELVATYGGSDLPLAPDSYHLVLRACRQWAGEQDQTACEALDRVGARIDPRNGPWRDLEPCARGERIKECLRRSCRESAPLHELLQTALNGRAATRPDGPATLRGILAKQHYRLCYWRRATEQINYRRFFNINDLVALRIDRPGVFDVVHSLLEELVDEGTVSGVRVDHVDGLRDPGAYLRRLRERLGPVYVVIEKILEPTEMLPGDWPVHGTTGYDFLAAVNQIFVDGEGYRRLRRHYAELTGIGPELADVAYSRKKKVLQELFPAELRRLVRRLRLLAEADPAARDAGKDDLRRAVVELSARLPVYRTYLDGTTVSEPDRRHLDEAFSLARRDCVDAPGTESALALLRRVLGLDAGPASFEQAARAARHEARRRAFIVDWQRLTGPVMAKGFEDTALYVFNALVSLNEVGCDPDRSELDRSLERFHERNLRHARRYPHGLNATSTHDTKRSEDVRARINVLSEMADRWHRHLGRWRRWNRHHTSRLDGRAVPGANEEILLYQTLAGAWPLRASEVPEFRRRLRDYLVKAAREARTHTRWRGPDERYERAFTDFAEAILEESGDNRFLADFLALQGEIAYHGALNALAQQVLKIASPGVPDFYQGTELWNLRLVDPDNRSPVDFARRRRLLADLRARSGGSGLIDELLLDWHDGRVKLWTTARGLAYRMDRRELFATGDYLPVFARGPCSERICAFARRGTGRWALAAVPCRSVDLPPAERLLPDPALWQGTDLVLPREAPEEWRNVLSGTRLAARAAGHGQSLLPLHEVLADFPVALLDGVAAR